uniref:Lipocalin n=1 Tax=Haemonchus contortus TaxID=6289 RepID=A0A7I4YJZ5_HAECO
MERLFFAFLIIGVVALVPSPKGNGSGHERAYVTLVATLLDANRTVEVETEIRNNGSRLGTVKELLTWNESDITAYSFVLFDTDCSKVVSWLKDVVHGIKAFIKATSSCRLMNLTNSTQVHLDLADITKNFTDKFQAVLERP